METTTTDTAFRAQVVAAADRSVAAFLATHDDDAAALPHRAAMGRLLALAAVTTEPGSAFYGPGGDGAGGGGSTGGSAADGTGDAMRRCLDRLEQLQGPTGLFDGTNLCSPPDSAFTLNDACIALGIIRAVEAPGAALAAADGRLAGIISRATDALVAGGVHTPNHRWELSAALARINALQPRQDIADRIDEWLAEGIDQLPDGMYSERSALYASAVTNPSLLAIADHAGRTELLDNVRRNLTAFLPWFNPDGTLESVFSRRQDQWMDFGAAPFLPLYRRLAIQDANPDFAAAAAWLGTLPLHEPAKLLALLRLDPWLHAALPEGAAGATATDSTLPGPLAPAAAALETCGAYRFRAGSAVTTVYGGCDDLVPGVVSGLASNPTLLRFAHGAAVLSGVRLSRSFFDLGPFRSQHTVRDGATVRLSEELSANFYLPLPAARRREDGIYALGHEGRFSASMDFPGRPTVVHRLGTEVTVRAEQGQAVLELDFDGADTAFALELTFRSGGVLDGVVPASGTPEAFQLVQGTGSYRVGSDTIEFGPGLPADPDAPPAYNPGENYRYLAGTNASEGLKVFITGRTAGSHRFVLRGSSGTP
ncbi:conserved hypothetical protein [Pseudarthrobacter chlorophenolicus A6]|uniref:Uncharacterized protein n=1 Tax=Pseudarthrobacter chlorophenolicus (strain ATCC 700700 / DSM 12829 / CIP 107037 / JCM 12360 / KCTC 9906 / NCIMB 13794 / A6) TaxID=452863 RepID=B8HF65_PSECP|nr:hypothetical protein [Pseudarthrobacter chlorophenolicus]ACL41033.1 conserved hypothetical protein [Pseudarthrobacter chlorophenolicus A6]SDQ70995.1 hypothetical protein SAMN04489738_2408 [Pseudarthrobacter chlorophenolicus]